MKRRRRRRRKRRRRRRRKRRRRGASKLRRQDAKSPGRPTSGAISITFLLFAAHDRNDVRLLALQCIHARTFAHIRCGQASVAVQLNKVCTCTCARTRGRAGLCACAEAEGTCMYVRVRLCPCGGPRTGRIDTISRRLQPRKTAPMPCAGMLEVSMLSERSCQQRLCSCGMVQRERERESVCVCVLISARTGES